MNLVFEWATVKDGNMDFRFGTAEEVRINREKWLSKMGIKPEELVELKLLNKTEFVEVGRKNLGMVFTADAVITVEPGVGLFLDVADCLPVAVYDPEKNFLALMHCGRAGIEGHLPIKVISRLKEMGSNASGLQVMIGPGARKESYKFAIEDLEQRIDKNDPEWRGWLSDDGNGQMMVDLIGFLKKQLLGCGVVKENIEDCGIDTISDTNYFSHYRDRGKIEGRFGVMAVMQKR